MAKSRNDDFWTLIHAERASLADDLATLSDEDWRHATLCDQWDVEEVVAHLISAATISQWRWVRSMLGARFRADVHNQRRLEEQRGNTPTATLEQFRKVITRSTAPSGHTAAYLGEVVVHAQDIRQPLGLSRTPDVNALTPVATFFAQRNFAVKSRSKAHYLQLRANDGPFSAGTGPLVSGSTLALVMSMAGRSAYLDQLDGPGAPTLRARVAGTSR